VDCIYCLISILNETEEVYMRGVIFLGEREVKLKEFPDPKPDTFEATPDGTG
jgi:hypothetical protein